MCKPHSIEYIKDFFMKNNYTLLENEYKNGKQKLKCICPKGHKITIAFTSLQQGGRCLICANKDRANKRKHSQEYVVKCFKNRGYELLDNYINMATPITFQCDMGHITTISLDSLQQGKGCKKCAIINKSGPNHRLYRPDKAKQKQEQYFATKTNNKLRRVFRRKNKDKDEFDIQQLGYTHDQLIQHFYTHPNWKNLAESQWTIDHIFPISAFLKYNILDLKIINALDNLQPLSKADNISKHNKYNHSEFIAWLSTKGITVKENHNEIV